MKVTEEWINENASYHGPRGNAWKAAQKDLLGVGNHHGWIERAVGVELSDEDRKKFESYRGTAKQKVPKTRDPETEPDWEGKCSICDASPIVPATGMCGPCTFGEADTIGETGNELDRTHGRTAVAFAAEMLMANDEDMGTMPVRDLIEGMRERAQEAFKKGGMVDGMVLIVLATRLEQEANRVDQLSKFLDLNVPTWRDEIATDT